MKHNKKSNLALMAQGINGIAEMYAELSRRLTLLEGRVTGLSAKGDELKAHHEALAKEVAALGVGQAALTDEVMQEYFYGKRGVGDE